MNEDINATSVKVLASRGGSVLVEWLEDGKYLERGIVPTDIVIDGLVDNDELALAIPFGIPWSSLIRFKADPLQLEHELHRVGIWDYDDLVKQPNKAIAVLQSVYSVDYAALKSAARAFSKESEDG